MPSPLLTLVVLAAPIVSQDPAGDAWTPLDYYRSRRAADALATRGDWARAVPLYERLVQHYPADGETWRLLALGSSALGDDAGAITAFEAALALGTRDTPELELRLAASCARVGEPDAAFAWIEASLAARLENRTDLNAEPGLASLRTDPRWRTATSRLPQAGLARDQGWRVDLDHLVAEARRLHVDPERPAFSQGFEDCAAALRADVPELTDDQVLVRMMRLIALLDDGHSALYGPGPDTPLAFDGRVLPFRFYRFPSGLHVVGGAGAWGDLAGSRVVRFGDVPAEDVLERLAAYRGVDNPMTWHWMGPQFYVRRVALLRAVGVTTSAEGVEVTLATPDGTEESLMVEASDFELVRKLRPSPAAVGDVPRYLRAVDTNYWMELLPDHDALYVQCNQVRDAPLESLAAFAARLRETLAESTATSVIVDVRHNNGGNNGLLRPLVRALIEFDARPEHRIFVLTGRNTFSAAQNLVNRLERWTDAVFAGEASSSSPNFVGEETELVLPYSRVRGSISSRYWQDSDPGDDRPWIAPDLPVELTAADYFENRDPVLDAVLQLIADG